MRTRFLWVVLPAVICGCGRTAPYDSLPAMNGSSGGGTGSGCVWTPGQVIDVDDAFPGPFNGPAITTHVAVNAWDDAHSLFKGRFVEKSFDWHGNAQPEVLLHQFSGPPTWLFSATAQEDGSVMAAWTDPDWVMGTVDTATGNFDTVATMNPTNALLVDVFRSNDRVFVLSEDTGNFVSAQIIENGVTSPLIALGKAQSWQGLTRQGVLEELIEVDNPNGWGGYVSNLVRLDPDATPRVSTVELGVDVLAFSRCPDGSLAFVTLPETDGLADPNDGVFLQVTRLAVDGKTVEPSQVIRKPHAGIGLAQARPTGLLCTSERIFIAWEDARTNQPLPEPGSDNQGVPIDQLWFTTLEADGSSIDPVMLDRRFDGYDEHPQLSVDGQTVVVTWLRADRGPSNHDALTRVDCKTQ